MSVKPQKSRITGLDGLRGIAAVYVMVWHYCTHFFSEFPEFHRPSFSNSLPIGTFSVWLFFGISGFVISMTLERINTPWEFIKARAIRLYPTYLAALIVTFLAVRIFGLPGYEVSFPGLFANLTMAASTFGAPYVDRVYWSLEVELYFYILMVLVLLFGLRDRIAGVLPCMLVPLILSYVFHNRDLGVVSTFLKTAPAMNFHWFVLGVCVYRWNKDKNPLFLVILAFALLTIGRCSAWRWGVMGLVISGVLLLAVNRRTILLDNRVLQYLGVISYSLYLIHQNIGFMILRGGLSHGLNFGICFTLAVAVSLALASLLTFLVERPVLAWYKSTTRLSKETRELVTAPAAGGP